MPRQKKRLAARLIGSFVAPPLAWLLRFTRRKAGIALLYHGIDSHHGDPTTELSPAIAETVFARQLHHLLKHYRVVPLGDFLSAIAGRRRGERFPVCVTFDDDLPQHIDFAMPVLRSQGVPATFFLGGATLNQPGNTWWERLQRAVDHGSTSQSLAKLLPADKLPANGEHIDIHLLGRSVKALTPGERRDFSERLLERAGPDPRDSGLRRDEVATLVAAGFEIGFHTRDHDTLTSLTDEELERSIDDGCAELSKAAGARLRAIAYPHGRADARVADTARRAGFDVGFTTRSLPATPASDPLLLGRCDVVSLSSSFGEFALGITWVLLRHARQGAPHE